MRNLILSLFACSILTACATLTEQGEEALQDGRPDEALVLFDKALTRDPNDAAAVEGQHKARQKWIERRLIDVRLFRLAGNTRASEKQLREILIREREWKVFPGGSAFSTQSEEIDLYSARVDKTIARALADKNPLLAQFEFGSAQELITRAMEKDVKRLERKIFEEGKRFCSETASSLKSNEFYTAEWLRKTCRHWNPDMKFAKLTNSLSLFKDIEFSSTVEKMPLEALPNLSENFKTTFRKSKWRDEKGSAILKVRLAGKFDSSQREDPAMRTANFSVQVPYEVSETRTKDPKKDESSGGLLGLAVWLLVGSSGERVHDNGDGTETVYRTEYRSEPRSRRYQVVSLTARKNLEGTLTADLAGSLFKFDLDETFEFQADRHNERYPDAGIEPNDPKVISDATWLEIVGPKLFNRLADELQMAWVKRFCNTPSANDLKAISKREYMNRCAYQVTGAAPAALDDFYVENWNLRYDEWRSLGEGLPNFDFN